MGTWDETCSLTGLPVKGWDKNTEECWILPMYESLPLTLPVKSRYTGHGDFEPVQEYSEINKLNIDFINELIESGEIITDKKKIESLSELSGLHLKSQYPKTYRNNFYKIEVIVISNISYVTARITLADYLRKVEEQAEEFVNLDQIVKFGPGIVRVRFRDMICSLVDNYFVHTISFNNLIDQLNTKHKDVFIICYQIMHMFFWLRKKPVEYVRGRQAMPEDFQYYRDYYFNLSEEISSVIKIKDEEAL